MTAALKTGRRSADAPSVRLSPLVVAAAVAVALPTSAQARTWLPPQTLTSAGTLGATWAVPLAGGELLGLRPSAGGGTESVSTLGAGPFLPVAQPVAVGAAQRTDPVADASGAVSLGWRDDTTGELRLARRASGLTGWGAPVALPPRAAAEQQDDREAPGLAVSPGGVAALVAMGVRRDLLAEGAPTTSHVRVALRRGDGPLEPATTVFDGPGEAVLGDVAVDDLGHVVVAFSVDQTAYVGFREADGTWRAPVTLGHAGTEAAFSDLRVALDAAGRSVVVWGQGGEGTVTTPLVAAFRSPGEPLGAAQPLGVAQISGQAVGLEASGDGEVVLLAHPADAYGSSSAQLLRPVVLSGSTVQGRFAAPEPLVEERLLAAGLSWLSLAMDPRGDAVITYADGGRFLARRRAPYSAFGPEEPLPAAAVPDPSRGESSAILGAVSLGADGQAVAVWAEPRGFLANGPISVSHDAGDLPPAGAPSADPVSLVPAGSLPSPNGPWSSGVTSRSLGPRMRLMRPVNARGTVKATLRLTCDGPCFVVLSGRLTGAARSWSLPRQQVSLYAGGSAAVKLRFPAAALKAMRLRKRGSPRPFALRSDARFFDAAGRETQLFCGGSFLRR